MILASPFLFFEAIYGRLERSHVLWLPEFPGNHSFRVSMMKRLPVFSSLVSCNDVQRSSTAPSESWRRHRLRIGGISPLSWTALSTGNHTA
ncbi:Uncharacterized protein HZ326_19532 [Fusarium oxysporum f. sp. albedinis]|nr:Uncharacterized protein HZ326_19532 [Fusarium oxysporum f. sp. albedinis]